jgi:hypothetical protein
VESSKTMIAPEPSMVPALASESKSYGSSRTSSVSGSTGELEPPGNQALNVRPSSGPPARSKRMSRVFIPSSIS